jgi:hypothetical protein
MLIFAKSLFFSFPICSFLIYVGIFSLTREPISPHLLRYGPFAVEENNISSQHGRS